MPAVTGLISSVLGLLTVPTDLRLTERHFAAANVTEIPIEDGTVVTDHVIVRPDVVIIDVEMSNFDFGFTRGLRAAAAWNIWKAQLKSRGLYTIFTRHEIYRSMALTDLTGENAAPYPGRLLATLTFTEVSRARLIQVSVDPPTPISGGTTGTGTTGIPAGSPSGPASPTQISGRENAITQQNQAGTGNTTILNSIGGALGLGP